MVEYVLDALRGQTSRVSIGINRSIDQHERHGAPVARGHHEGFLGLLAGIVSMMAMADAEWLLTLHATARKCPATWACVCGRR